MIETGELCDDDDTHFGQTTYCPNNGSQYSFTDNSSRKFFYNILTYVDKITDQSFED